MAFTCTDCQFLSCELKSMCAKTVHFATMVAFRHSMKSYRKNSIYTIIIFSARIYKLYASQNNSFQTLMLEKTFLWVQLAKFAINYLRGIQCKSTIIHSPESAFIFENYIFDRIFYEIKVFSM